MESFLRKMFRSGLLEHLWNPCPILKTRKILTLRMGNEKASTEHNVFIAVASDPALVKARG